MIERIQGDILKADAVALVNTVNCVGVMGRGIALQFRKAFPENFKAYKIACAAGEVRPGKLFVHPTGKMIGPQYIINFPTKDHWRGKSRLSYIESGLEALVETVRRLELESVAVPPLGCGLGGLKWSEVRSRIEKAFEQVPEVKVLLYEPGGAPPAREMARTNKKPKMTPGRAALIGLVERYLAGFMDVSITVLEIQKLMYFLQESGEDLQLRFVKAPYGPYAENLRHVLNRIEGHWIHGYADGGDQPNKEIQLADGVGATARDFLAQHPDTRARFDRVSELVAGFETYFGMELLATVYWLAEHEGVSTFDEIVRETHNWNPRKKMFETDHLQVAWNALNEKGWFKK